MSARRRAVLALLLTGAAAAIALGMLGVASGEGPAGSTAARSLSVEGVGTLPIGVADTAAQATAVYREGMASDSQNPAGVYFGTNTGKVFGSADEGDTWQLVADNLPPIYSVATAQI